jgi:hypothetical protein
MPREIEPHQYIKPGAPRYKLTEAAYIDDKLYQEGDTINYDGIPGYHMEPLDKAAEDMKKKYPSVKPDPIAEMTDLKMGDATMTNFVEALTAAIKGAAAARA